MKKGYITVYFSIAVTICISLLIGLVYGARENAIRQKTKSAVDISLISSFGEYQKELWSMYDMIFVDSTYGYDVEPIVLAEEHFENCLERNFDEEKFSLFGGKDFLKLNCVNVETNRIRFFGDNDGQAVRDQAAKAIKYRYGVGYVEDLYEKVKEVEELTVTGDLDDSFERAKEALEDETDIEISEWKNACDKAVFSKKEASRSLTIGAVFKDVSHISSKVINREELFQYRGRNTGNLRNAEKETTENTLLFKEYVLEYFGNLLEKKPDSVCDYEVEYCIVGDSSDAKNLEGVLNRILLLREALNAASLAADTARMSEIEAASELISALLVNPESAPAINTIIFLLWIYAESIADLRGLVEGKRVPVIKTEDQWQTGMSAVFGSYIITENDDNGLNYKDYLRLFLLTQEKEELTLRAADLMEINIRSKLEDYSFKLDNCFDAWEVTAYISSDYGYDYIVTRKYDMEDF